MTGGSEPASRGDALPVVAVGGGLAGAAFALELARNGRRVVLLERTLSPSHKVCGEFLSEETGCLLASLGLDVRALGAMPIASLRLVAGERQAVAPLPFAAAALSRCRLDQALLSLARRAGASVVRGAAVTGIEPDAGGVAVRAERRQWRAAAVGLATGKHCVRGLPRPAGTMVGFKLHLEATSAAARDLSGIVQLVFFRGGYVGACLIEERALSVAWVMNERLVREVGAGWPVQREHLARQSSRIGDLLAGARPLFAKPAAVAAIPYGFLRAEAIAPQVYPVGDQLAVVPSFTGDGMAIALHSGRAAARALLGGQAAGAYQRELTRELRPQFFLARGVGLLLETPATCAVGVALARLLPSLATGVAQATRLRRFRGLGDGPALGSLELRPPRPTATTESRPARERSRR
jgi:flavin-dependent dehydrogenase